MCASRSRPLAPRLSVRPRARAGQPGAVHGGPGSLRGAQPSSPIPLLLFSLPLTLLYSPPPTQRCAQRRLRGVSESRGSVRGSRKQRRGAEGGARGAGQVEASMMEIYNERVRDLFNPRHPANNTGLKVPANSTHTHPLLLFSLPLTLLYFPPPTQTAHSDLVDCMVRCMGFRPVSLECASLRVSPRRSACGGGAGQVRENPKTGPYVDGLSTLPVTSYEAMMTILKLLLVGSGYQQAMMIILKLLSDGPGH